ncbi:zinc-ribbon domain-containing protein [Tenacibaculum sp. M341]|uniref:zinc-ribbon domain-containing protein n=1 Tax=Tenacibaculum sp. M341 TaxID=2530339 RepID=UPI00104AFFF3|nr:zinc ribbon domain-containing protein [Tenacibaculum sp. M341]
MALIKCKECGHKVSDTAKTCVNCGYDLSNSSSIIGNSLDIVDGVGKTAGCLSAGCAIFLGITISSVSLLSMCLIYLF